MRGIMARLDCPKEVAVTKAIRSGGLDDLLTAHAVGCEICREIVAASAFMQGVGEVLRATLRCPTPACCIGGGDSLRMWRGLRRRRMCWIGFHLRPLLWLSEWVDGSFGIGL